MINYSKRVKLKFNGYAPIIQDVPLFVYERLRFYEKYMVLALQTGVIANTLDNLIENLSNVFNIKSSFVEDFVKHFEKSGHICSKTINGKKFYTLSPKYKIKYSEQNHKIMQAYREKEKMTFNNLIYIEENSKFYDKSYFFEKKIEKVEIDNKTTGIKPEKMQRICNQNINIISGLLQNWLNDKMQNLVLCPEGITSFNVADIIKYEIPFELRLDYKYDGNQSVLQNMSIISWFKEEIDENFQNQLRETYLLDHDIPEFIVHEDFFINEQKLNEEFEMLENEQAELEIKKENRELEINRMKEKLIQLDISKEKELEKKKNILSEIKKTQDIINQLTEDLKKKKQEQSNILLDKVALEKATNYSWSDDIKLVREKYNGKFIFETRIITFNNEIQRLLEAMEKDCLESALVTYPVNRDNFKGLMKAIFDVFEGKETSIVAEYFGKSQLKERQTNLKNLINNYIIADNRKMNDIDIERMNQFYTLINAAGHQADRTERSSQNEKMLDEFLNQPKSDCEKVILSFVKLFKNLDLTEQVKKTIDNKIRNK